MQRLGKTGGLLALCAAFITKKKGKGGVDFFEGTRGKGGMTYEEFHLRIYA